MENKNLTTRELVMLALYAALFIAFEVVQNQFGLFAMPQGGSMSISAVVLLLASYHLGYKKGVMLALISVILQFITGRMFFGTGIGIGFILDYVVGYGVYGLASLFPNFKYLYTGVIMTNLTRYLASTLSGMLFYGANLTGSLAYNATYMIPTTLAAIVLVPLIHKRMVSTNLID